MKLTRDFIITAIHASNIFYMDDDSITETKNEITFISRISTNEMVFQKDIEVQEFLEELFDFVKYDVSVTL